MEENFAVARYKGGQKGYIPRDQEAFRYDAYISYVHREPDVNWVWETLIPHLEHAGVRIAVSGVVEEPGVSLVVGIGRAVEQSKRTVVVLSQNYLADNWTRFRAILAYSRGVTDRQSRIFPVLIEEMDARSLPDGLDVLTVLDLTDEYLGKMNFERLPSLLMQPLWQDSV